MTRPSICSSRWREYNIRNENEQALEIVKELGYLPLAIEQAAAYIDQVCNKTLSKFLPRYKENRLTIHQRVSFGGRQYSKSVATTWILSVNAVRERNADAARLLKFLAYLAPDFILIHFLKAGCDGVDDDLKRLIANDESFDNALFTLEQFSLLKRETTKQGDGLIMHRLVQAFLQDESELKGGRGEIPMVKCDRFGVSGLPDPLGAHNHEPQSISRIPEPVTSSTACLSCD